MERKYVSNEQTLPGYDTLTLWQHNTPNRPSDAWSFRPNEAYDAYHRMHKIFVGEGGSEKLVTISNSLSEEWMPRYLDAAGWAAAEAALVQQSHPALDRVHLLDQAMNCWERAILAQEQINDDSSHTWLHEASTSYRIALNLAFIPLMKSLVLGNVTEPILEQTFVDTLAIAQASTVQRALAYQAGDETAVGDYIGLGHECNALLTLLYMNDPRHIPLPSSTRAGSGYEYPDKTHDIVVVNQHWGKILKIVPIEIKARATKRDIKRYEALIIRGKMHLSINGMHSPEHTLNAFSMLYDGMGTPIAEKIVNHVTSTMQNLLVLYQKGKRVTSSRKQASQTRFHDKTMVVEKYPELSLDRATQ